MASDKGKNNRSTRVRHSFAEVLEAPIYWSIWSLLKSFHDTIFYSWAYIIGKKNVPPKGTPLLIASNHVNGLNDPLSIIFGFGDRIVSIFARADVYNSKPFHRILAGMAMLPAYRLEFDGENSLINNFDSFKTASERLLGGNAVAIFPEARNQAGRWLGKFSLGYLRLAFQAAEESGFEKDIVILPICNHYTGFFRMRERMMLRIGTPIHLQPYYERFKEKPRTVQREINALVRGQIEDMMLNITDSEHYDAIEYLRITEYGKKWCTKMGLDPYYLPDKLTADKKLVARLDELNAQYPEKMDGIYKGFLKLKEATRKLNIRDWIFDKPLSLVELVSFGVCLGILLPLFLYSLIPNILIYYIPYPITKKLKAKHNSASMFVGGVHFILSGCVTIPLFYSLTFVLEGLFVSWIYAAIHLFCLPFLGIFAWNYRKLYMKWKGAVWYRTMQQVGYRKLRKTRELRNRLFFKLDTLLYSQEGI